MRYLPLLILTSCAATAPELFAAQSRSHLCVTSCGMVAYDLDCAGLQEAENAAIKAAAKHTGSALCSAMAGWKVVIHKHVARDDEAFPADCFEPKPNRTCTRTCPKHGFRVGEGKDSICVVGYTWTETRTMEVAEQYLPQSSLAHEMFHAFDYTKGNPLGHCKWTERGRKAALLEATGIVDGTLEFCSTGQKR